MGLAFSQQRIVREQVTLGTSSPAELVGALDAVVRAAGWAASTIDGGYRYTVESPQGLRCEVTIRDPGASASGVSYIEVQWASEGGAPAGVAHRLGAVAGRTYMVHVGVCQLFVSVPGMCGFGPAGNRVLFNTVCGGIPFVGDTCSYVGPLPQAAWWSSGDGTSSGVAACNFRKDLADYAYPQYPVFSACWDTDLMVAAAAGVYDSASILRLVSLHPAGWTVSGTPARTVFHSERPLFLEPLLAWGSGAQSKTITRIRGQVWDALLATKRYDVDSVNDFGTDLPEYAGLKWAAFSGHDPDVSQTGQNIFGTLFLLTESAEGVANVAY
jgi:hypothetical protein